MAASDVQWWCAALGEAWSWTWRAYPGVWLFVLLVAWGVHRRHRRDGPRSADRGVRLGRLSSAGGVLLLWLTLDWPVGPLGTGYLASVHAFQFLSLAVLVPLLLLAGVGRHVFDGSPAPHRGAVLRRAGRWLGHPMRRLVTFAFVVVATHAPSAVDTLMRSQLGALALDLSWLGAGLFFWRPVVLAAPGPAALAPPMRMLYVLVGTQVHLYIAVWLLVGEFPRYALYELAPRATTLTAMVDQQVAGVIMLVGMLPVTVGVISVVFFRWWGRDAAAAPVQPDGGAPPGPRSRVPSATTVG